jgi:hypothetical protein
MADTWSEEGERFERRGRDPLHFAAMRELVERALQRELACRRDLRPHAQLGVPQTAPPPIVDSAYASLQQRYNPDVFAEYGDDAVAAARGIVELLHAAYREMREPAPRDGDDSALRSLPPLQSHPRRDETRRALESLRLAISRRIAQAEQYRDAGQLTDAIRVFESVVILDRNNKVAHAALHELRAEVAPQRTTVVGRLFARVLRRASR